MKEKKTERGNAERILKFTLQKYHKENNNNNFFWCFLLLRNEMLFFMIMDATQWSEFEKI